MTKKVVFRLNNVPFSSKQTKNVYGDRTADICSKRNETQAQRIRLLSRGCCCSMASLDDGDSKGDGDAERAGLCAQASVHSRFRTQNSYVRIYETP